MFVFFDSIVKVLPRDAGMFRALDRIFCCSKDSVLLIHGVGALGWGEELSGVGVGAQRTTYVAPYPQYRYCKYCNHERLSLMCTVLALSQES